MDSLKEKDNPAPNPAKRPRIEVDEELMRQMIAGQAPLDSEVVRRIPEPEEEDTNALEENTSETVSGASAPTAEKTDVDTQTTTGKESAGFRRKKIALPDFERTFFAPVDCRNRSAIYVSAQTKHKVSEILHLLGNENTRLTALVDNMLRFVMNIYSDELNRRRIAEGRFEKAEVFRRQIAGREGAVERAGRSRLNIGTGSLGAAECRLFRR